MLFRNGLRKRIKMRKVHPFTGRTFRILAFIATRDDAKIGDVEIKFSNGQFGRYFEFGE